MSPTLDAHVVDFDVAGTCAPYVTGDCALTPPGTTRARAGGTGAQRRVDGDPQLASAKAAALTPAS